MHFPMYAGITSKMTLRSARDIKGTCTYPKSLQANLYTKKPLFVEPVSLKHLFHTMIL